MLDQLLVNKFAVSTLKFFCSQLEPKHCVSADVELSNRTKVHIPLSLNTLIQEESFGKYGTGECKTTHGFLVYVDIYSSLNQVEIRLTCLKHISYFSSLLRTIT